jgi:hypothetical protein
MRIGRDEAFDLLRKFSAERTLLECTLSFVPFVARFRARLTAAGSDEVRLMSDNSTSELVFRLAGVVDYYYGDARNLDTPNPMEGVVIFVYRYDDDGANDSISLAEVVPVQ